MIAGKNVNALKFFRQMHALSDKYWCPDVNDESYWDNMALDSIELLQANQTEDPKWNEQVGDAVAAFMNFQEAMANLVIK